MVEFLFGHSGSGKTTQIYNNVRRDLSENKRVMLIVPDQEAVSAEAMCADVTRGIPSTELFVCSFSRLCNDVFRKYGGIVYNYADKTTGRLLVFLALRQVSEYLKEYNTVSFTDTSVLSVIHSTIGEFKRCGISAKELYEICEKIPEDKKKLKDKLSDIALIYDAYDSNLGSALSDPSDDMTKLCDILDDNDFFSDFDSIYVDSFHYFTHLQQKVLYHVFKNSPYVCISICAPYREEEKQQFTLSEIYSSFNDLLKIAKKANVTVSVAELKNSYRFANDEMKYLEEALREEYKESFPSASHVSTVICQNPFDEVEFVSSVISGRVREDGKRYRDFAVVVNSADSYKGIADAVFDKFNIPYFMSARTDIMQKPFVKLVFAAFNIHLSGFYREDVISYIKTGLSGLSYEDTDLFETYVKRWGINGKRFCLPVWEMNPSGYGARFSEKETEQLKRINRIKDYIITPLYDFSKALSEKDLTCEKILSIIFELLVKTDIKSQLSALVSSCDDEGEKSEIYQIWNLFFKAATDISDICKDTYVTADEYRALLSMVLSEVDIGKIPTSQDQVLIGESGKIRINNPSDIFILGVNEGDFPSSVPNNTVFSFADIRVLQNCGIFFNGEETLLLRDTFDFYKTVTSCRENVFVTSTVRDSSGNAKKPSVLFNKISGLFPNGNRRFNGITADDVYTYAVGVDFIGRDADKKQINSVKALLSENQDTSYVTENYSPTVNISEITAKKIYSGDLKLSQSKIDSFKKCKFGYYCNYVLNLKNDNRIDIENNDLGTYVHFILQKLLEDYIAGDVKTDISEKELKEKLDEYTSEFTSGYLNIDISSGGYAKIRTLFERMKKNTVKAAQNILCELESSEFKPSRLELKISENGEVPPLKIRLSDGSDAVLGGIADRVDTYDLDGKTYVKLMDYKTGKTSFSLDEISECNSIQLFVYMISICSKNSKLFGNDIKPAAAFYVAVTPEIKEHDRPIDTETADKEARDGIVRRGAVLDEETVKKAVFGTSGKFMPKYAQDKKIEFIPDEKFEQTFEQLKTAVSELGEKMKMGMAEALPKKVSGRMPCEYCDYKMICRYESETVNEDE